MDRQSNDIVSLDDFTDEELQRVIDKRKKLQKDQETPKPLDKLDQKAIEGLKKICGEYINEAKDGWIRNDTEHYIFEAVIEAFYGKKVWEWIRTKV